MAMLQHTSGAPAFSIRAYGHSRVTLRSTEVSPRERRTRIPHTCPRSLWKSTPISNRSLQLNRPPIARGCSFLGTCNWLREYVPRFAEIVQPLTDLLGNQKKWRWGPAENDAFLAIKRALAAPLPLHRSDPTRPYVLQNRRQWHRYGGCALSRN
jgi:hypothetical protein